MNDSQIYQEAVALDEAQHCNCYFCKAESFIPPAEGDYAEGTYIECEGDEPISFRDNVCEMHKEEVEWITFRWIR